MNRELENKTNHLQLVGCELLEIMDNVLNRMSDEEFDKTFEEISETYPNAITADKYIELLEKHGNKVFNTENQQVMLVNRDKKQSEHVKFISYNGKYPCLCYGTLTLEIDGKTYKFGDNIGDDFGRFWSSGGSAYFTNDYSDSVVEEDEWNIDVEDIPQEFRCYAEKIDRIFNDNVPYGCCGGCL